MAVIAVAGFQHETNTFAPSKATMAQFEHGGGWPPLARGPAALAAVEGLNIPLAGFAAVARAKRHRLVPLVWANATPSAHVTADAFEAIAAMLIAEIAKTGPLDAVYLDLHGAMVAEHVDDGDGEILARVRRAVGARVPLVASLDLHANVSPAMIERAEGLVAYRSYPHVDMAETGARAAALMDRILEAGEAPAKAFRQLPFLIPLTAQCTLIEPARGLYAELGAREAASGTTLSFTPGFPAADIADCGPAVFGYGGEALAVEGAVGSLARRVAEVEGAFALELLSPEEAVKRAMARPPVAGRPVVLADTQDNPGAGGNGDTVGLLAALLAGRAEGAVVGLLIDAEAARLAHAAGPGAELEFSLGAKSGLAGHEPLAGRFTVERLGDGNFTCTGPFYGGNRMRLGAMAALRQGGVVVALASVKVQAADQEMFRHLGIEPMRQRIVALKSSVHFRAHFQPIAAEVLVVAAPGPAPADPAALAWRKLRPGMRLKPLGPVFAG
ncbi:MAG: M81 family metallopeptidase [Pseudomonadota bacterium]